jgi:regulator of chromosome condensation
MDQQTQFMPVSIKALEKSRFVSVACGNDHVVALSRLGHVWCFGNGQQAQLGRKIIEVNSVFCCDDRSG